MWKQAIAGRLFLLKNKLNCSDFCPTFIASSSPALATVQWPRNEDSKNGFNFAVGRPEAEIIDILSFNIIWAFSFEATQRSDWSEDIGWKKGKKKTG